MKKKHQRDLYHSQNQYDDLKWTDIFLGIHKFINNGFKSTEYAVQAKLSGHGILDSYKV